MTEFDKSLRPKVGVGIMIFKEGKILLGYRKTAHGAGDYAFPGGHVEHLESFEQCAIRETLEECGLKINNVKFQFLSSLTHFAPKHYTHVGMTADWESGEPQVLEPEKQDNWQWYDLDHLPEPLFIACQMAVESYKTGKNFFDSK